MDLKRHLENDYEIAEAKQKCLTSLKRHIEIIDEATDPKRVCLDSGK